MPHQPQPEAGSFRTHMDEILDRLAHDGVVGAGYARPKPPPEQRPSASGRCPAYHNQALFERSND